jgi:hypothetical protein
MRRAHLLIRHEPHYRREAFAAGLQACGYQVAGYPRERARPGDLLVMWNRYGANHALAERFEAAGGVVLVAENGLMGRDSPGGPWYSLFRGAPAGAGWSPEGPADRWFAQGWTLAPWRDMPAGDVLILAQRGIGPPGVAQPHGWHRDIARRLAHWGRVRIREHPGERPALPLADDLANVRAVVTWASAAALKAMAAGVPVFYGFRNWIGKGCGQWLDDATIRGPCAPVFPDRTATCGLVGWATWTTRELSTGQPFRHVLGWPSTASPTITDHA